MSKLLVSGVTLTITGSTRSFAHRVRPTRTRDQTDPPPVRVGKGSRITLLQLAAALQSEVAAYVDAFADRLTFGGNIIETGTDSYRLAHTPMALFLA